MYVMENIFNEIDRKKIEAKKLSFLLLLCSEYSKVLIKLDIHTYIHRDRFEFYMNLLFRQ